MTATYYAEDRLTILHGDALNLELDDDSVDLIVTSPPYFALRSYTDGGEHYAGQVGDEATPGEYVAALVAATREWMRVLKPSGSLWVNLGDKYAQAEERSRNGNGNRVNIDNVAKPVLGGRTYTLGRKNNGVPRKSLIGIPWRYALACIDDLGLILRAEVIWSKPNGLPESVTDRVRRSHEQWFHFTLQPRYFSAVDAIREPYDPLTAARYAYGYAGNTRAATGAHATGVLRSIGAGEDTGPTNVNPLGKLPGSVWDIATQPLTVPAQLGVDHFAAFPMEWPRRIIAAWCPDGGVVLDPFGGTGTTALVAWALGRHGISNDLSGDYCRLARWRCTDPAQRAAAMQVAKPPVPMTGQEVLL